MKKFVVFGITLLCGATLCAGPHRGGHHHGNKGVRLATDIVNLVGASVNTVAAVVAPRPTVVVAPPPPVVVTPPPRVVVAPPPPVVVAPPPPVVVAPPPPVVVAPPPRVVVAPPPRHVRHHRPAPPPRYHHGRGHHGGRR